MQQMIFIADLIACSTCFGQHYAHNQELENIIHVVAACGIWWFDFQVVGLLPANWTHKQIPQAATTCIILSSS